MEYFQVRALRSNAERGVALIEASVMFILLLMFFGIATSAGQYVMFLSQLDRVLDKVALDQAVIPYELDPTRGSQLADQVVFRKEIFETWMKETLTSSIQEEFARVRGGNLPNSFEIYTDYYQVDVDPVTGEVGDVTPGTGFFSEKSEIAHDIVNNVGDSVEAKVQALLTMKSESGEFLYATPTALHSLANGTGRFSPKTMMVYVRVVWDVRDEYFLQLGFNLFGQDTLSRQMLVPVRGDISL